MTATAPGKKLPDFAGEELIPIKNAPTCGAFRFPPKQSTIRRWYTHGLYARQKGGRWKHVYLEVRREGLRVFTTVEACLRFLEATQ